MKIMNEDADKNLGGVANDSPRPALVQFDVGERNYGLVVGRRGYIVTENDFCHQVRPLNEPTDLRDDWSFGESPGYQRVSLAEMLAKATPILSYRKWAHYWGIKSRIAANYNELLRSMREIGADREGMPRFGEEPVTSEYTGLVSNA